MSLAGVAIVALRESLEALLVCGILVGIVTKLGHPEARRPVIVGGLLGLVASVAIGLLTYEIAGRVAGKVGGPAFEAVASLTAVAILTYMIVWMYKHTQHTIGLLHAKAKDAVLSGRSGVLLGLAFVVVIREGLETVALIATYSQSTPAAQVVTGLLLGIAIALVLAFLIFRGVVKLSIEAFFAVTGVMLIVIAGGLLGYASHEAEEAGWLPDTPKPVDFGIPNKCGDKVTFSCVVGGLLYGLIGYRPRPAVLDLALWAAYVGAMTAWYLRPILRRRRARRAGTAPPASQAP
jgi:high-affinity iron transporter